jgi:hypothetical protein
LLLPSETGNFNIFQSEAPLLVATQGGEPLLVIRNPLDRFVDVCVIPVRAAA